jgi:hypothetical protein
VGFLRSILSFVILTGLFISQLQPYLSNSILESILGDSSVNKEFADASNSDKKLLEKDLQLDFFLFLTETEFSEKVEESDESKNSNKKHFSQSTSFSQSIDEAVIGLSSYHSLLGKISVCLTLIKDSFLLFEVLRL